MYTTLLVFHNMLRWLVLASLLLAVFRAARGYWLKREFSKIDNAIRHWTATLAHVQLVVGLILYSKSPAVKFFWSGDVSAKENIEYQFWGIIHIGVMLLSVILITIGSAMAKRQSSDTVKFKTMLLWFLVALALIFIAVPWPFSPFANRPLMR